MPCRNHPLLAPRTYHVVPRVVRAVVFEIADVVRVGVRVVVGVARALVSVRS
jgi:hypothetical protein